MTWDEPDSGSPQGRSPNEELGVKDMAQPRPSMTLILDLDERVDCEELRLEIGRSYAYVGSTLVRTHAAAGEDAGGEHHAHAGEAWHAPVSGGRR